MNSLYSILNRNVKNWWYFVDLRKANKIKEARSLERKSILENIERIRKIKKIGGYLKLGKASWSIYYNGGGLLSGYYNKGNHCYYEEIFEKFNLLIIDSRNIQESKIVEYAISSPMLKLNIKESQGFGSFDYVTLKDYIKLCKDKNYNVLFKNAERYI